MTAHKCWNCSKSLILEDTPFDVVIGCDTLRTERLVKYFPHYFVEPKGGEVPLALRQSRDVTSTHSHVQTGSCTHSLVQTGSCTHSLVQTGPYTDEELHLQ